MFGLYGKHNKTNYKQIGGDLFGQIFYFDEGHWRITDDSIDTAFEIYSESIGDTFPPTKWTVYTYNNDMVIPDNDLKIVTGAEVTEYKPCHKVTINFDGTLQMKAKGIKKALGEP